MKKAGTHPKVQLKNRLSRLQGQAGALLKLLEDNSDWEKMILLSSAIEGAADQVTADLFQGYLESMATG